MKLNEEINEPVGMNLIILTGFFTIMRLLYIKIRVENYDTLFCDRYNDKYEY